MIEQFDVGKEGFVQNGVFIFNLELSNLSCQVHSLCNIVHYQSRIGCIEHRVHISKYLLDTERSVQVTRCIRFIKHWSSSRGDMMPGPYPAGERAFSILRGRFLAHIPVHGNNFHKKCTYVAVMLRRMMEAILNKDAMDDKDYMGNKRFKLSESIQVNE